MKILVVVSTPSVGGTETLLLSQTPYLEKLGCKVDIFNTWRSSLLKGWARAADLSYQELTGSSRYIHLKDLTEIIRTIRVNKYDIVQSFGYRITILLRLLRPFFLNTPLITGLHGLGAWRHWYHALPDRLTQGACSLFVPISEAVAQASMAREKYPRHKMVVIHNGTEIHLFDRNKYKKTDRQKLGLPANKIIITTLATLIKVKGHDFYLDAISKYLREFDNVHFVWIGQGPLQSKLEEQIKSAGITEKITVLGFVEDVRPLLACSDIFVLPSRAEGMPRAMMEAMSMSLPCVATNVGGIAEVIEDGVSGLLAEFGDVETFGRNIISLVNDKALRNHMGLAARNRIKNSFDMELIAKKHIKLFEMVAAGCRDGRKIQRQIEGLTGCSN